MSPCIVPSLEEIVGANIEKIDKVDFRDIHTDTHTRVILYCIVFFVRPNKIYYHIVQIDLELTI